MGRNNLAHTYRQHSSLVNKLNAVLYQIHTLKEGNDYYKIHTYAELDNNNNTVVDFQL